MPGHYWSGSKTVASVPGRGKAVSYSPDGPEKLREFEEGLAPHVSLVLNEHVLRTLDRMVSCDALVMSRSSLSASAAYLKRADGLVVYHPFWHSMLGPEDGHVSCDDPGLKERVRAFVEGWAAKRR